ncbi:paraquat-inducible protein A [Pseudophaeobacter leonis]|uniref:paraquat-inducible protein A n=1 Tax=Pseudophaeobacter leonis TaxID=1144477 RepID=UPI001F4EEBF1|nr:paraquat-inducible protein A [Pseudophaeobacter leonis]
MYPPLAGTCTRCGSALHSRAPLSLQRTIAWLLAGLIAYVPASIYPMLLTSTLFERQESTILGGVVDLLHHGSFGDAVIVFVASVVIPIGKFLAILYLVRAVGQHRALSAHQRQLMLEIVEFIGRWSMIDVFVVAILSALVQLDSVATINPGIAAVSFALSVVFTMLAAQSLDSRLIWDGSETGT